MSEHGLREARGDNAGRLFAGQTLPGSRTRLPWFRLRTSVSARFNIVYFKPRGSRRRRFSNRDKQETRGEFPLYYTRTEWIPVVGPNVRFSRPRSRAILVFCHCTDRKIKNAHTPSRPPLSRAAVLRFVILRFTFVPRIPQVYCYCFLRARTVYRVSQTRNTFSSRANNRKRAVYFRRTQLWLSAVGVEKGVRLSVILRSARAAPIVFVDLVSEILHLFLNNRRGAKRAKAICGERRLTTFAESECGCRSIGS